MMPCRVYQRSTGTPRSVMSASHQTIVENAYLHPLFHALVAERDHIHPILYLTQEGNEGKGRADQPDGIVKRRQQRKCSLLSFDHRVPLARLHHAEILTECEF